MVAIFAVMINGCVATYIKVEGEGNQIKTNTETKGAIKNDSIHNQLKL